MTKSTITEEYKTTVPEEVRERLGVGPSDILQWEVVGNRVLVTAVPAESAQKVRRFPPGAGAFDSGHTDTADRAEEILGELGFGKDYS